MPPPGGYTTIKGAYFQNTPQGLAAVNDPNILKQLQSGQLSATPQTSQASIFSPKVSDPSLAQSLTTLSSDKTPDIYTAESLLEQQEQKGVTTAPDTGIATNADGTVYTPDTPEKIRVSEDFFDTRDPSDPAYADYEIIADVPPTPITYYTPDLEEQDKKIQDLYAAMKSKTDSITAAAIGDIQERYIQYIKHQKEINESTLAVTKSALIMSGAAKHDVFSQDAVQFRMNQNAEKITDLENEENALINAAKAAQLLGEYRILEKKVEEIQKVKAAKIEATLVANEDLAEADKEAQKVLAQVKKDNAIASAYSLGYTTVPSILSALRKGGYKDITLKYIADTLDNIIPSGLDALVKTMRQNYAPPDVIASVMSSTNMSEAYEAAGAYGAGGTGIIGEYNFYRAEAITKGQVPVDFLSFAEKKANLKAKAEAANIRGLPNNIMNQIDKLSSQFDSAPIVKQFNEVLNKKLSVDRIIDLGVGGPGDLALVFEFMKALDPTSVVRESEYDTAAKSGNIFKGWAAKFNGYMKAEGGFLPEQVKESFQKIIATKYSVINAQYNNLRSETGRKIDMKSGAKDGLEYLTNYEAAVDFVNDLIDEETKAENAISSYITNNPDSANTIEGLILNMEESIGRSVTSQEFLEVFPEYAL